MVSKRLRTRDRRRRLRRLGARTAFALLALLLATLAAFVSLQAPGVRRSILDRVAALLAEDYGLAFSAADFTPLWRQNAVELRSVRIGAPGAAPFATVARLRGAVDLGSLRRGPLVVRWLEADGLRVDLAAPLPTLPRRPAGEPASPPPEIRRITVRRGEVRGEPLPPTAKNWLRGWSAAGIEAQGSYRGGRLEAVVDAAEATLDRPGFGRQRLLLGGRVGHAEGGPLRLDQLRVTGDGLRLEGSGRLGLEPGAETVLALVLHAEPHALIGGLPRRGQVTASANLALPAKVGRLHLRATDLPAEALRPYLDAGTFADLSLAGSVADLEADASFGPGDWARATGTAGATWRRGERALARSEARLLPGNAASPVVAVVSGELLPGAPGRRVFRGTVRAAGWTALGSATTDDARAEIQLPELAKALADVRSLWPRLVPKPPAGLPIQGSLVAAARLAGPLLAPLATVDATWLPQARASLRVEAKGRLRDGSGSAKARAESLPLALLGPLAPSLAGTLSGSAELSGSPRGYRTRVDAAATAFALPPARAERLGLTADGSLRLSPWQWVGTVGVDGEQGEVEGRGRLARFAASAEGTLGGEPLSYTGTVTASGDDGEAPGVARVDHLALAAEGRGGLDPSTIAGELCLDAGTVTLVSQATEVRWFHLEADGDRRELRVATFSAELVPTGVPTPGAAAAVESTSPPDATGTAARTVSGSGRITLDPLLAAAELDLRLARPVDGVTAAELTARLHDGLLVVDAPAVDTAAGAVSSSARIPLAALRGLPALAEALGAIPGPLAEGPVTLSLRAPALDSLPLVAALGLPPRPERIRAGLAADLSFDPSAPAAGRGELRLTGLDVETADGRVSAETPAVLRLADGRLELQPVHLRVDGGAVRGAGLDLRANADLAGAWRPFEDPLSSLPTHVTAAGNGTLDATLLNPYLAGGVGAGSLVLAARAEGPPQRLAAELEARGPDASFVWPAAGLRISQPQVALALADGRWTIREGRIGLNGGTAELTGGRSAAGELAVEAELEGVRYRLAYGIDTQLSGRLALLAPPAGRSRLAGRLVVERGVLDRDLDLDREVLTLLFQPVETESTEESALAAVDLDLEVETTDGVRVKNNVGDLHATWRRLELGGTLESPVVKGRIDIDPGGLFYAYGQTVRIDRGSLLFTGDPLTDPKMELATTSSLVDPRITRLRGESPLDLLEQQAELSRGAAGAVVTAGLTSYYGARFVQRLGESAGLGGFTVRPVLVFQEANPSARLTVGRELSRHVSLALSLDLRNAERQTYLLYVAELPNLPGLRLEGFTNDAGHQGGSLQQAFELGGSAEVRTETGPRLRRITIAGAGNRVSRRLLRGAVRLERKQRLPAGAAFGVEVDVAEHLRRKGYPDRRLTVTVTPVEGRPGWADLMVAVEPGPRARVAFAGDRPPRALRREIADLYRTDFYEPIAVEEMRQATVRALRAEGHLDPQVTIAVERERPAEPDGRRTVTVRSEAGPRRSLVELEIAGLDADAGPLAAASFPGTLARAELAAARPDADRRLLAVLRSLGYPQARIAGRGLAADGSRLVVSVEPGARQVLATVAVTGVDEEERARLADLLPLHVGDPARADLITAGALRLEDDLRRRGFARATVQATVTSLPGAAPDASAGAAAAVGLTYEVTPGIAYRLASLEVAGGRWSRPAPMRRETGLAVGEAFSEAAVEQARNQLFRTGVFSRVDAAVEQQPTGEARVTFSLAERPRFRLGYGVRWESDDVGTAAVLDFVDQNFLGRALTFGLRGLYQTNDRSGRFYLRTGAVLGTRISFETYAEERRQIFPDDNQVEDRREVALQASRPLGGATTARVYLRHATFHLYQIDPDPFFPFDVELRRPYLGAQLVRDTRDDPADPTRGLLATADLSGSAAFLGSDFTYVRLFAQAVSLRGLSLGGRRWTWAQGLRVGVAQPLAGQTNLVEDERFFAGGPYSVRGYPRNGLGSREVLGGGVEVNLDGKALLVVNEELRLALPWDLTALAFFDAGQVWARPGDASFDLAKSFGLGLRAHTPVGLLRFDAAYPLDRRRGDPAYQLHVGFGNAF